MDPRDVQSIPLFAGLSKDDQQVVAQYADEVDVKEGKVLAEEGRLAYEFFAIKDGTAEVKLGGQHTAALGPGDFFGEIVGRVTTGGYGYTVGRSIAYAYLPPARDVGTAVEVDIFGQWIAGELAAEPLYDPRSERVRV